MYTDSTSELLYHIIRDPKLVETVGDQIVEKGTNNSVFSINDAASLDLSPLKMESYEDRIRILALFELAGQHFKEENFSSEGLSLKGNNEIVLSNGQSMKVVKQNLTGLDLFLLPIRVDSESFCSSIVDGVEILPGKFAYGVFSKLGLHKVLSPTAQNGVYKLRISVNASGMIETLVHNKLDGTQNHMVNVKSFCVISEDNYAYVDNYIVYCHHDEILAKRIRDEIGFLDCPLFIQSKNDKIFVTMNNGDLKCINI